MTEDRYSDREINMKFDAINDKFCDVHDKLDIIIAQTTRTNGRVSKLERWQQTLIGAGVVLGAISIPNLQTLAKLIFGS